jgi:hypothetical protein
MGMVRTKSLRLRRPPTALAMLQGLSQFRLWPLIDLHHARLFVSVAAIAAPRPLLRLLHKAFLHRVAMHIAQLFHSFALAPHMEVIKSLLPDVLRLALPCRAPNRVQNLPRESLLHDLHNCRRRSAFRLAEEQVDVVGHYNVADHNKLAALSGILKDLQKQIAPMRTCQPRLAMVTATGEKVEIIVARVALEAGGHFFNLFEGQPRGMERSKTKSCDVRIRESRATHPPSVRLNRRTNS